MPPSATTVTWGIQGVSYSDEQEMSASLVIAESMVIGQRWIRKLLSHLVVSLVVVAVFLLPTSSVWAQTPTPVPPTATPIPASISVTPAQGSPRTSSISVSGFNFTQNTTVNITYDGISVGSTFTSSGSWIYTFMVPASPAGSHIVKAGTLEGVFTVVPTTSISPTRGTVGTSVTISGDGFAASQQGLPVTFDGEQMIFPVVGALGSFTASFSVPPRPAGAYGITVGSAARKNFTVTSALAIDTPSGPPGTTVLLNGSGFGANSTVSITFDGKPVRSVSVDSGGSISTSFQVPAAPGGPRSVGVSDPSGGSVQTTYSVTPLLALDHLNTSPGASITANGIGFAANESGISVSLGQTSVATGILADKDGSWITNFVVPSLAAGSHTVRASGPLTTRNSVPALTVTLGAELSLGRSSGPPGTALKVTGAGFGPAETITIAVGDGLAETGASANSQGVWTANITIPPAPSGRLIIRATGARGQPKETDFIVTPAVSLSRPTGSPGTAITISGQGFRANQRGISISFGSVVVASPSANVQGSWNGTFTVPPSPAGTLSIGVAGANPQIDVPFTVTPAISIGGNPGGPRGSITINGSGFAANEQGITVTLDQTPMAAGIAANAAGSWSVSFPLPSLPTGSYSIRSSGSQTSGTSVLQVSLTVGADLNLERSTGAPGTGIKVSGAGFRARETVTVTIGDGLGETIVAANDDGEWTAVITIPPAPGGTLVVRASGTGGQRMEADITVVPAVSLSQPIGSPGSSLKIEGNGFRTGQDISVSFAGGVVATSSVDSQGSWTASFPIPETPADTYSVEVSTSSGTIKIPFLVTPIVLLNSSRGEPGETFTVSGSGFAANENGITVTLDQSPVASGISAAGDGSWVTTISVPDLPAASYAVRASGPQTSTRSVREGVLSIGPRLEISPASGGPGMSVNVAGRGFGAKQRNIVINYDGTPVATVVISDTIGSFTTSFVVPPSASGLHFINHSGGIAGASANSEVSFQVIPVISLDRSDGPPGTDVAISGSGFLANDRTITIIYEGKSVLSDVRADGLGSFTASFPVPPSPAGTHVIEASGSGLTSQSGLEREFTVTQSLALNSTSGNVGAQVELAGLGFFSNAPITLVYGDGLLEASANADALGSFRVSIIIPSSKYGDHVIKVVDTVGFEAQTTFSVESTPPAIPALLAPSNGAKGGLLGGFRPATKWASVDDPSGISYVLQVDTSPDFSSPVLEKRGLANPAYVLTEQEALSRGEYYWRVKAVDGALNESPWSNSSVVVSGIIPVWLIPALAVLGLVVAGGSGYAVVQQRRRRWRRGVALPELVREVGLQPALPAPGPGDAPALRPAPRIALPAPARGRRNRSPEEQARLHLVVDFMRSLPLLQVSSDLTWMEELVETMGSSADDIHEQVLDGQLVLVYQPGWIQHPTFEEVMRILQGHEFLQSLEDYIQAVNDTAGETVRLLRQIHSEWTAAWPQEILGVDQWRFVQGILRHALTWFRGTYLKTPSTRDYVVITGSDSAEEPVVSVHGEEDTPFSGPLVEGLPESDALAYRDLHLQLRARYANSGEVRLLAARMASLEILKDQLTSSLAELDRMT